MHQPDIDATSTRPPAIAGDGGGSGWFREGDAPTGVLGSILTATFMNDLLGGLLAMKATTGVSWTKGAAGDSDLANMILKLIFPLYSFTNPGYLKLGNGLIVNWHCAPTPTTWHASSPGEMSSTCNFALAFSSAVLGCWVTQRLQADTDLGDTTYNITALSLTGVTVRRSIISGAALDKPTQCPILAVGF